MPHVFFIRQIVAPKNMPNCHIPPQIYAYLALLWIGTKLATVIDDMDKGVSKTSHDNVKRYRGTAASDLIFCQIQGGITKMALVPLGDRILVKRSDNDEQTTSGGIIIPDTAKEKPQEGEVIAVGGGRILDSGERQLVDVAVGDLVLFAKYGGTEVTYDNDEYLILREDDILAKVN
jgi:chaperonin GroES